MNNKFTAPASTQMVRCERAFKEIHSKGLKTGFYRDTYGRGKKIPSKKKELLKRFHLIGHKMLDIGLNTKVLPSFFKLWIFPTAIQSPEVIKQERVPLQLTPTAQRPKMAALSELGQRTN